MKEVLNPDIEWIHIPLTIAEIESMNRIIRGEVTEDIDCEIVQPKLID